MASKNLEISLNIDTQTNADQAVGDINALLNLTKSANKEVSEAAKRTIAQLRGFSGEYRSVLELQTVVNNKGLKEVMVVEKKILDGFTDIENATRQAFKVDPRSLTSLREQVNTAKQQRDAISKLVTTTNVFGQSVAAINPKWDAANQKVQQLTQQLNRAGASNFWDRAKADLGFGPLLQAARGVSDLVNTFQSIAIIVGQVTASVNALIGSFQELQAFQTSFEAIGEGAMSGTMAFQQATSIAATLGTDLRTTREGFKQLTPVVLATGGTVSDVSRVVESLSTRFLAFGRSADESKRIMNGVIQAFAKGKLMSEELTQQIAEADPAFKTDLANAVGVSVQALEAMVEAGEITGQVLLDAIPKMAASTEGMKKLGISATDAAKAFKNGDVIITQVLNKFKTIETVSFEKLGNQLKPFIQAILEARASLIDFFAKLADSSVVADLGQTLAGVVTVISQVVLNLLNVGRSILTLIQPVIKLINAFGQIPGVLTAVSAVITAYLLKPFFSIFASFNAVKVAIGQLVASFNAIKAAFTAGGQAVATFSQQINAGVGATSAFATLSSSVSQILQGNIASLNGVSAASSTATQATTGQAAAQQGLAAAAKAASAAIAGEAQANSGVAATASAASAAQTGLASATTREATSMTGAKTATAAYSQQLSATGLQIAQVSAKLGLLGSSSMTATQKLMLLRSINLTNLNPATLAAIAGGVTNIGNAAGGAASKLANLGNSLGRAGGGLGGFVAGLAKGIAGMVVFEIAVRSITAVIDVFDAAAAKTDGFKKAMEANADATQKAATAMDVFNGKAALTPAAFDGTKTAAEEVAEKFNLVSQTAVNTSGNIARAFDTNLKAVAVLAAGIKGLNEYIANGLPQAVGNAETALQQYNAALGEFGGRNYEVAEAVAAQIKSIQQLIDYYGQLLMAQKARFEEDGKISDVEKAAMEATKKRLTELANAIDQIRGKAIAVGLDTSSFEEAGSAMDRLISKIRDLQSVIEDMAREEISDIQDNADDQISDLEEEKRTRKEAFDEEMSQKAAARTEEKQKSEDAVRGLEAEKALIKDNADTMNEAISEAKEQKQQAFDQYKQNLEIEREKENENHQAKLKEIEALIAKQKESHDKDLAYLDEVEKRETESHNKRLAQIDAQLAKRKQDVETAASSPTSAASQLQQLDTKEKEKQLEEELQALRASGDIEAANALQRRAELEKKAAEEEKAKQEELKRIEEEAVAAKQKAETDFQNELTSLEQQRQASREQFEAKQKEAEAARQEQEATHEANIKKSKEEERNAEAQFKADQIALDQQADAAKADAKEAERGKEEEIAKIKDTERETDRAYQKEKEEKQHQKEMKEIDDQIREIRRISTEKIRELEEKIKDIKKQAKEITDAGGKQQISDLQSALALWNQIIEKARQLKSIQAGSNNRALGGPVSGGSTYTVNEAGREAFLSASGRLSMINAPAWGSWTAPSAGLVIPASITKGLNIPRGGINPNKNARLNASRVTRNGPSMSDLLRVVASGQNGSSLTPDHVHNISATQAQQAIAIGKLSRAVRDLNNKDWNVNVRVQNGGSNSNYLHTLNTLR